MTPDTAIINAVRTLHERFIEEPTRDGGLHIRKFIEGSRADLTPLCAARLHRYDVAMFVTENNRFSEDSITHLKAVAEETLT